MYQPQGPFPDKLQHDEHGDLQQPSVQETRTRVVDPRVHEQQRHPNKREQSLIVAEPKPLERLKQKMYKRPDAPLQGVKEPEKKEWPVEGVPEMPGKVGQPHPEQT